MIVGFDIDEVLADFINPFLRDYVSPHVGREVSYDEVTDYNMTALFKNGPEALHRLLLRAEEDDLYKTLKPKSAVHVAVELQYCGHNILYVSSRPGNCLPTTLSWLETQGLNIRNGVFLTRDKPVVCREAGIEVFVEDSLSNAVAVAPEVDRVYLLARPWNKSGYESAPDNVYRITDEMLARELGL